METPLDQARLPSPPMMADELIPSDSAILALCLACGVLAYLHSGPKVAGTLLVGLVMLFALADRAFGWSIVLATSLALAMLLVYERHGAKAPAR